MKPDHRQDSMRFDQQQDTVLTFLAQQGGAPVADAALALAREVMEVLARLNMSQELELAAVLHVLHEDGELEGAVAKSFGAGVARLYHDAAKVASADRQLEARAARGGLEQGDARYMMLLAMMEDVRVVFIVLARQVALMRHLKEAPEARRRQVAEETMAIHAPLANRLGIGQIKWELEDLAFRYLQPEVYKDIARKLEERRSDRQDYIDNVVAELRQGLEAAGIRGRVYGRPKHIYSIWRKMETKHKAFHELFDVRAVRILVDDIESCYAALGVVHAQWQYIPGEYDDYIAAPKANGYQSLHTAVVGPSGKTLEVQIRTHGMNAHAELGVAAHWLYKEGAQPAGGVELRINRIRDLLANPQAPAELAQAGGDDRVYIITPKGDVIDLPAGATPLDFAYRIHSDIGHRCRGAKVNGRIVPLTTALKSGQEVEIVLAKEPSPSRDWLSPHAGYLKTSKARAKVRQWFKQQFRDQDIADGRAALQRELTHLGVDEWPDLTPAVNKYNFTQVEDLLAAIGRGEVGAVQALNVVRPPEAEPPLPPSAPTAAPSLPDRGDVQVVGVGDLLTHMARCCQPLPGDAIVGYITRGRGVTIHRKDCPNVPRLEKERLIEVSWGVAQGSRYEVDVEVEAMDRPGLLRDVTAVLSEQHLNVVSANTHSNKKTHEARMRLRLVIADNAELQRALAKLTQIRNVLEARRVR